MDKNEDIFSARKEDWWNNACLNFQQGGNSWTIYSMGYKSAADILVNYIDKNHTEQDTLLYPIIFLYRHYLELIIKDILIDIGKIQNLKYDLNQHKLSKYWKEIKEQCPKIFKDPIPNDYIESIEIVINQLELVDQKSDAFRYPCHRDGTPTLIEFTHINIKKFSEPLQRTSKALEAIGCIVSMVLEQQNECKLFMGNHY